MEKVRERLLEAGREHRPDRARMLARIERGMAESRDDVPGHRARGIGGRQRRTGSFSPFGSRADAPLGPVTPWVRVIATTAAACGVLFVGGLAVGSAVRGHDESQTVATYPTPQQSATPSPTATRQPAAPSPTVEPPGPPVRSNGPDRGNSPVPGAGTGTGTTPGASSSPTGTASAGSPAGDPSVAVTASPGAGPEEQGARQTDGFLSSVGAVDRSGSEYWAQSRIDLTVASDLTSLTVELRITQTGGVTSTGAWRTLPEQDFDLTVAEQNGTLVYRWTLKDGLTVPTGKFTFAAQYNHEQGDRNASADRYRVDAVVAGGESTQKTASVEGRFTSRSS